MESLPHAKPDGGRQFMEELSHPLSRNCSKRSADFADFRRLPEDSAKIRLRTWSTLTSHLGGIVGAVVMILSAAVDGSANPLAEREWIAAATTPSTPDVHPDVVATDVPKDVELTEARTDENSSHANDEIPPEGANPFSAGSESNQPSQGSTAPESQLPTDDGSTHRLPGVDSPLIAIDEKNAQAERSWKYFYGGSVSLSATDNLFLAPSNKTADVWVSLSPRIGAGWGNIAAEALLPLGFHPDIEAAADDRENTYLFAYYSPTQSLYFKNTRENSLNHAGGISAHLTSRKLRLGWESKVETLSGADVEIGNRADRTLFNSDLSIFYEMTGKLQLETHLRFHLTDYSFSFTSYREWIADNYLNYQIGERLSLGLGLTAGYVTVENSASQVFEQAKLRAYYRLGQKLDLTVTLGAEARQVSGGDSSQKPIFAITALYRATARTELFIEAERRTYPSLSDARSNTTITAVQGGIRQKVLEALDVGVIGGYSRREFYSVSSDSQDEPVDHLFSVKLIAGLKLTPAARVELAYEASSKNSNVASREFTANTLSLQFNMLF